MGVAAVSRARCGLLTCERWESNPHPLRDRILNPARLPVPPLSRVLLLAGARTPRSFAAHRRSTPRSGICALRRQAHWFARAPAYSPTRRFTTLVTVVPARGSVTRRTSRLTYWPGRSFPQPPLQVGEG